MQWQGCSFRFVRLPGHSPGSTLIYMTETAAGATEAESASCDTVIFTGDYLIKDEEEVLRLKGGSEEDFLKYTKGHLDDIPPGTHLYPGHGPDYVING